MCKQSFRNIRMYWAQHTEKGTLTKNRKRVSKYCLVRKKKKTKRDKGNKLKSKTKEGGAK